MPTHYIAKTLFVLVLFVNSCLAQSHLHKYSLDAGGTIATSSKNPFWNYTNQYGIVPDRSPNLLLSGSIFSEFKADSSGKNKGLMDWGYGLTGVGSISNKLKTFIPVAYIKARLWEFQLSVGKDKNMTGLLGDTTLSSGSFAISGNALTYSRIQISIPKFVSLPLLNQTLAVQGNYSDGLLGSAQVGFGNTSHVPRTYMHQKSLYIRLGVPQGRFFLYGGFNHQAIWGGESKIFTGGLQPKKAYKYVVLGKVWEGSRVGNHFGTIDLGMEYKAYDWVYFLYRQSIYEDGSLYKLSNIKDGLNGIVLKRNNKLVTSSLHINTLLAEFIYTKNQGGEVFDFATTTFGRDNYYNHYVYNQGWSYKGRGLGSPVIPNDNVTRSELDRNSSFTNSNRLWAIHVGMGGNWNKVSWKIKTLYSQNYGTYNQPFSSTVKQLSYIVHAEKYINFLQGCHLSINVASDVGKLYYNSSSINLGLRKTGIL